MAEITKEKLKQLKLQRIGINGLIDFKDLLEVELKLNVFLLKKASDDLIEYIETEEVKMSVLQGKLLTYLTLQRQFPNFPYDAIVEANQKA